MPQSRGRAPGQYRRRASYPTHGLRLARFSIRTWPTSALPIRAPAATRGPDRRRTRSCSAKVADIVRKIQYGTVVLVIQDGKVVQIEMAEKFRLR